MGHKVPPPGYRVGIFEDWRSRWYAKKKEFGGNLVEDQKIRKFIKKNYAAAAIPKVEIERTGDQLTAIIYTARPGVLIGRKGANIEKLQGEIAGLTKKTVNPPRIKEIDKPELVAQLVAESIKEQLQKRASFRRTMKHTAEITMEKGARGVKIQISGRLGGAEMARRERITMGKIPLSTLRADIDYGFAQAFTTYGQLGIKVWIYRGDHPLKKEQASGANAKASETPQGTAG
jgi:small subunit ribosomal protein S3